MSSFWGQKTFCVITGASRGLGKAIAIEFSKNVKKGSTFLLMAKTSEGLATTKREIHSLSPTTQVHLLGMDLTKPDMNLFASALRSATASPASFEHALIVHCASSVGDIKRPVIQYDSLPDLMECFTIEIFSTLLLTSELFKCFGPSTKQRSIVSISSVGALEAFKSWGMYCAVKSSKEMFMKVIALEEGIQVMSYDPCEMDTDTYDISCRDTGDAQMRQEIIDMMPAGKVRAPQVPATKLVEILATKKYLKGEHVVYENEI